MDDAAAPLAQNAALEKDAALEKEALAWTSDPFAHFGYSNTKIHSVPREEAEAVQLAGLNLRLEQRRQQIPVLAKLADAQGIKGLASLDDAAPLLFTHDVYKSYPVSLLAKQRFDQLTKWLDRLTQYDITGVDVSGCDSIDSWLTKLRDETPLDVATSSGTSGTLSFFPKSQKDYRFSVMGMRVQLTQEFGKAPTDGDLHDKIHALTPLYRDGHSTTGRFAHYIREIFCNGDDSYLHTAFPYKISSDLMWLAARLRAAAAKGDVTKVDVPESLLARRAEWEEMQKSQGPTREAFIREVVQQLKGQRVFAMGTTHMFYEVAHKGVEEGLHAEFAPGSVAMGGGGAKGMVLPDDAEDIIKRFFNVPRLKASYGMTELNGFSTSCEHDRYHVLPWIAVFLLDQDSGRPLPRTGVQTGRAAFFDLTHDGTWGGVVTGDRISVDFSPCKCGRTTPHIDKGIKRFSEITGEDDKITCAATPNAQGEALDYLNSF